MKRKKDWYRKQRRERQLGLPFSDDIYSNFIHGFLGKDEISTMYPYLMPGFNRFSDREVEKAYYNRIDAEMIDHFAAQIKENNEAFADDSIRIPTSIISQSEADITTRK